MIFSVRHCLVIYVLGILLSVHAGCAGVGGTSGSNGAKVSGGTSVLCFFCSPAISNERADTLDAKRVALAAVENKDYRDVVAEVVHAFEPNAFVSVAGVMLGPDGARTVDVQVWSADRHLSGPTVIDVIDRPDGVPLGINAVDAADSKRRDLRAAVMLLCSNTGFDISAIQKAKRANIGLISVLKQGDKRIKGKIVEEIYLRKVKLSPMTMEYEGRLPADYEVLKEHLLETHDLTYEDGSVSKWLQQRAIMIAFANPLEERALIARFELKSPTEFLVRGSKVMLKAVSVRFRPQVQWLSQIVTLDAKSGIYDYVRGRVRFAAGENSYVISGVNFATAKPLDTPPSNPELGVGLAPGEVDIKLVMFEGLDTPDKLKVASIDHLIRPEDLSLMITKESTVDSGSAGKASQ